MSLDICIVFTTGSNRDYNYFLITDLKLEM